MKCTKHQAIQKAKSLLGVIEPVNPKEDLEAIFHKLKAALPRSKKAGEYLKNRALFDMKLDFGYNCQTHYKHLKNCIVFPLRNQKGEIVSLYGRSLTKGHYYLENRTGLYPSRESRQLIITESIIDSAIIGKYTEYETLALYGTNGLTAEHTKALQDCKQLQEIILFLEGDIAGQKL